MISLLTILIPLIIIDSQVSDAQGGQMFWAKSHQIWAKNCPKVAKVVDAFGHSSNFTFESPNFGLV